jgi:phage FluMu gp28-like protein
MIPEIRKTMDDLEFRSSYCCEFIDERTSFFPFDLIYPSVNDDLSQNPQPWMDIRLGIDFGKKRNSTVIIAIQKNDGRYFIRNVEELKNVPYTPQLELIRQRIKEWNPNKVFIDAYGIGIRLHEELRASNGSIIIGVESNMENKDRMINDLKILFEDKRIELPRNEVLLSQLHSLEKLESGGPYARYKHEPGKHDDYVWALAYGCQDYKVTLMKYARSGTVAGASGFKPMFGGFGKGLGLGGSISSDDDSDDI